LQNPLFVNSTEGMFYPNSLSIFASVNTLLTKTTCGVRITVHPRYEDNLSFAPEDSFVFSYHIIVENQNDFPVKLLRRHWYIFDSVGVNREVEGAGVVGETPLIMPGEFFSYSSACDLKSPRGSMHGFYTMQRFGSEELFEVKVPQFNLEAPHSRS
jgi:ApaG protein